MKNKINLLLFVVTALLSVTIAKANAAEVLPRDIPLQNPGFEKGMSGWSVGAAIKDQVSVETTNVHDGAQAVKIDATQKNNMPYIGQTSSGLTGASVYEFSVWARTAPGSPPAHAALKMENYNAAGKNTSGPYGQLSLPDDGTWKRISVTSEVDHDTIRTSLLIRVMNGSAVIFDDASFALVKNPAEVTIVAPTQQTFKPEESRALSYEVYLHTPWTSVTLPIFKALVRPLELLADAGAAKSVSTSVQKGKDNQHFVVSLSLPPEANDYEVNLGYERDGQLVQSETPAYVFSTIAMAQRKPENLTDDGTILHNGKPFFPIGMYHAGTAQYELLAANGFNAVQGSGANDLAQFKAGLDIAQKYGIASDVPLYGGLQVAKNLKYSLEKLKYFADHPAILDWKIIDEPELRPTIAHEVPPVYRALKKADPKNPIELTISGAGSLDYWGDFCDIVQVDVYPLPARPMTEVADKTREAFKAKKPWQNLSFVLQCGWVKDLSNQPSVPQARSMVYMALIEGAKGIWWYSMSDPGWDLTKTPLWPHMKEINAEIKDLSQPLMLGKVIDGVSCDQTKVLFRAVEYQNKTYLLMTNPEDKPLQAVFTLPSNLRSWHPLNSDTVSTVKDQKLTLSLQGIDSRTIVLEK